MRTILFSTQTYDRDSFLACSSELDLHFQPARLTLDTAALAQGHAVVCAFINDDLSAPVLECLAEGGTQLIALRGSRELSMRLEVEKVRHLINPPGQWLAVAKGRAFKELSILQWKVDCDACGKRLDFEFAVDASLGKPAETPAAEARIAELGWAKRDGRHLCPTCQETV